MDIMDARIILGSDCLLPLSPLTFYISKKKNLGKTFHLEHLFGKSIVNIGSEIDIHVCISQLSIGTTVSKT